MHPVCARIQTRATTSERPKVSSRDAHVLDGCLAVSRLFSLCGMSVPGGSPVTGASAGGRDAASESAASPRRPSYSTEPDPHIGWRTLLRLQAHHSDDRHASACFRLSGALQRLGRGVVLCARRVSRHGRSLRQCVSWQSALPERETPARQAELARPCRVRTSCVGTGPRALEASAQARV